MNKITYLDATRWYRALIAGIRHVISRQDYLNNINVFPVPDRDTGTNLALTLNAIIEGTYAAPKSSIQQLFNTIADSAISGARGNSGAIIAQFFQGMANGAQSIGKKMEASHFALAVQSGVDCSYAALSEPKEGTILTTLRAFSERIRMSLEEQCQDFVTLLHNGLEAAYDALQKTTKQLSELQKAHVVDAGAQGFVDLLQGIYDFIHHGSLDDIMPMTSVGLSKESISEEIAMSIDEKHRYCTECLILGDNINSKDLREKLQELGNSLVIAGSPKKTKVHIHTNNPAVVFALCREHGSLTDEKADDMIQQQRSINHKRNEVAILTDSGADIPAELIAELDIHVVPLQLQLGLQSHIDKVTISPEEFYQWLRQNHNHPTTSQPSHGDFHRQYQYLSSHYQAIIAIHLPKVLSGTLQSSQQAAKNSGFDQVHVFDAGSTSVSHGLLVLTAAQAAKAGKNAEDIMALLTNAKQNTHFYAVLPDLSYLARGGRISSSKIRLLRWLNLVPVISFEPSGKAKVIKLFFGRHQIAKRLAYWVKKQVPPSEHYKIMVSHCDNAIEAERLEEAVKTVFGNSEIELLRTRTGATLGAHGGPESFGLAIQKISV
jgi:hypothetical protein